MKFIIPYILFLIAFFGVFFSVVYFTTPYTIEDFKDEAYTFSIYVVIIGIILLFYYLLYRFFFNKSFWLISKFGMTKDENRLKNSFGVFAFECFLISFGIFVSVIFIGFLILVWYYSVCAMTLIFLLLFEKDTKWKYHIKTLVLALLIIFIFTMYQYRNSLF